ncbi:MAG TPA: PaaI family thioesterase [Candidatus Angelobacter sp.]|nr:PaaI family thioesterase [Candidatus Angelobacter sp.]
MSASTDLEELKKFMTARVPYWKTLGLELKEVAPGKAVFEAHVRENLMQNGILHGGVLASIVDSACAVAAVTRLYPTAYATTINLRVSYLRPVVSGVFRAEGTCIKAGKSVLFSEAEVVNHTGEVVCRASSELLVVPNRG